MANGEYSRKVSTETHHFNANPWRKSGPCFNGVRPLDVRLLWNQEPRKYIPKRRLRTGYFVGGNPRSLWAGVGDHRASLESIRPHRTGPKSSSSRMPFVLLSRAGCLCASTRGIIGKSISAITFSVTSRRARTLATTLATKSPLLAWRRVLPSQCNQSTISLPIAPYSSRSSSEAQPLSSNSCCTTVQQGGVNAPAT